jgi:hypothetical protein
MENSFAYDSTQRNIHADSVPVNRNDWSFCRKWPILLTMKKGHSLFGIILLLFLLPAKRAEGRERDVLLGLNTDVAPFGIESVIPGAALFIWPLEEWPLSPGADGEVYLGTDRFELSSHLYLRAGTPLLSPFAGAGIILLRGNYFGRELNQWYPEVQLGCRIALPRFPLLYPVISVRIKENDTDSNILTLGGLSF